MIASGNGAARRMAVIRHPENGGHKIRLTTGLLDLPFIIIFYK